jgi:nitroreductase
MAAPSGNNLRPWHFIVVRDSEKRAQLAKAHRYAGMLENAPVVLVVCADTTQSARHWVEDTAAATQNILNMATALGLGSCWVALHPDADRKRVPQAVLNLPDHIDVLCAIAIGVAAAPVQPRTQFDDSCVHREVW